jgi:prepilin-type N-terminal cleavage/methylation domain-containing protein
MNGLKKNNSGFALIEVMVALFLFAVFMAVFATTQGYNVSDSFNMKEELVMSELCKNELNQIILEPPKSFGPGLFIGPGDTKPIDGFPNYNRTIKYKEFFIPDFNKVQGLGADQASSGYEAKIYQEVKTNLQKMLYQVEVTVTNKDTGLNFTLSTFIQDTQARVQFMGF